MASDEKYITELEKRTFDYWLEAVSESATAWLVVEDMEKSLSWRVTAPLRIVRVLQKKIAEVGVKQGMKKGVERYQRKALEKKRAQ
jgi:hypothetical protein